MNFRDFYKKEQALAGGKGDNLSATNVNPEQLTMGIKVEMEHTHDPKLAREIALDHISEDPQYYSRLQGAGLADELSQKSYGGWEPMQPISALNVPSRIGAVSIARIINPSVCFGKGAVNVSNGQAVGSVPEDKEKITAAGEFNSAVAQKSVGGSVIPNKGQKQGGPNTKGNIAGTPKEVSGTTECAGGPNTQGSIGGTAKNPSIGLKGADLIKGGIGVSTSAQTPLGQFEEKEEPTDEPDEFEAANRREQDAMAGSGYDTADTADAEDEEGEDVVINLKESIKTLLKEVIQEVLAEDYKEEDVLKGAEKEIAAIKKQGVTDVSKHAEDLAKQIAKFKLKKNPQAYSEMDEASDSQRTVLDDIVRDVLKKAEQIGNIPPEKIAKVVAKVFQHQYGKPADNQAVTDAIVRNMKMGENRFASMNPDSSAAQHPEGQLDMMSGEAEEEPEEGPYVKNQKCKVCGKTFTPEWGEFERCPDCLGKQHSDAEKDNAGIDETVKFNKKPKTLKKPATQTVSKLQKEAAFISRKINEGRELTADEKDIIQEIILSKALRVKEGLDADRDWEHAGEAQSGMLDAYIEDAVKYRSKTDTFEDLVGSIAVTAEDKLGIRHPDFESIEAQVRQLWNKYPPKY